RRGRPALRRAGAADRAARGQRRLRAARAERGRRPGGGAPVRLRRRVVVHGRVQGVWFRHSTLQEAEAAGVASWVTNRPDGTVEAVFEGEAGGVERLLTFCRSGPPRAEVVAV